MAFIDAHVHLATWPSKGECKKNILSGMERFGIDISIISHADCSSFPGDVRVPCPPISAVQGLTEVLELARENPGKIYASAWIKPLVEPEPSAELTKLICDNRDVVVALKLHPFCERISPCDPRMEPYYELARHQNLPVLCHTALDFHSSIGRLILAAKEHPDIRFVAAHLELGSDHNYAINALKEVPNVFADTAWVDALSAKKALDELGDNRVFFGTDAPIDGENTLGEEIYLSYLENRLGLPETQFKALMRENALSFYSIHG